MAALLRMVDSIRCKERGKSTDWRSSPMEQTPSPSWYHGRCGGQFFYRNIKRCKSGNSAEWRQAKGVVNTSLVAWFTRLFYTFDSKTVKSIKIHLHCPPDRSLLPETTPHPKLGPPPKKNLDSLLLDDVDAEFLTVSPEVGKSGQVESETKGRKDSVENDLLRLQVHFRFSGFLGRLPVSPGLKRKRSLSIALLTTS